MRRGSHSHTEELLRIYATLRSDHGTLGWWPGRTRFEIIIGAILTQNTAWRNVEKALSALRARGWLRPAEMSRAAESEIAAAIHPSGYYRQKAGKLIAFLEYLNRDYGGRLDRMARTPTDQLRSELIGIWGIGPETADSILLYAFRRPVFVVDTYTDRLLQRHGLHPGGGYDEIRSYFEKHLPVDEALYNDFHAQIVWVGSRYCGTIPRCGGCPLSMLLPPDGPLGRAACEKPKDGVRRTQRSRR